MMFESAVLITGAGQRVGYELAKRFLAESPYPVLFTYRTHRVQVDELESLGAIGYQVDFTDSIALKAFIGQFQEQVKSLRLLVHNASLWQKDSELSAEGFASLFQVHQQTPYQLTLALQEMLIACDEVADVVAISDCKIKEGAADYAAYLSTKAGLKTLMDSFAKQFAPKVKVNTIASGLIMFNEADSAEYRQQRLAKMALPVEPGVEVIWNAIIFLMNSANTTGSTIELGQLSHCEP